MENIAKLTDYLSQNFPHIKIIEPSSTVIEKYINLERGQPASPTIAFQPKNDDEIEVIINALNKFEVKAVIFAGNTGLVSAQRAQNQAVIDLCHLDNLISLELENNKKLSFSQSDASPTRKAEIWLEELINFTHENNLDNSHFINAKLNCQAATPIGTINYILERAGQELPIDMGSITLAGGMTAGAGVANASHGTFGLIHGKMSDLCLEAKAINGNGTWRTDPNPSAGQLISYSPSQAILNSAIPQYGNSSLGTQGTFALITQLKLITKPLPHKRFYFLVKIASIAQAQKIKEHLQPKYQLLQFELMNNFATEIVAEFEPQAFANPFYNADGAPNNPNAPLNSPYLLLIQITGEGEQNLAINLYDDFTADLKLNELDIAYAGPAGNSPEDFIALRHSISACSTKYLNSLSNQNHMRLTPDLSVPTENIENFVSDIESYAEANNAKLCLFGHFGVGSFHVHIFLPQESAGQSHIEKLYQITSKYNGSCWSEHGIGTANAKYYTKFTPQKHIDEWLEYKQKYDPKNVLSSYSNGFDEFLR